MQFLQNLDVIEADNTPLRRSYFFAIFTTTFAGKFSFHFLVVSSKADPVDLSQLEESTTSCAKSILKSTASRSGLNLVAATSRMRPTLRTVSAEPTTRRRSASTISTRTSSLLEQRKCQSYEPEVSAGVASLKGRFDWIV